MSDYELAERCGLLENLTQKLSKGGSKCQRPINNQTKDKKIIELLKKISKTTKKEILISEYLSNEKCVLGIKTPKDTENYKYIRPCSFIPISFKCTKKYYVYVGIDDIKAEYQIINIGMTYECVIAYLYGILFCKR